MMSTTVAKDTNAVPDHLILSYTRVSLETTSLQTFLKNKSSHLDPNSPSVRPCLSHQLEPVTETSSHM